MMTTPPPINATPLQIHTPNNTNSDAVITHRIVSSASSLRGNNNNNSSSILGNNYDGGGDVIVSIVETNATNNNNANNVVGSGGGGTKSSRRGRKVIVQRMDDEIIASFDLPPNLHHQVSTTTTNPKTNTNNNDNINNKEQQDEDDGYEWSSGYTNPIICWSSFCTDNIHDSNPQQQQQQSTNSNSRKMLCILSNPTTLLIYDVLGDTSFLATSPSLDNSTTTSTSPSFNNNKSSSTSTMSSSSQQHTIPLPFRASSIHSNNDYGLFIVRLGSEEDYYYNNIGQEELTRVEEGDGKEGDDVNVPLNTTPVGLSLPATPRHYHHSNDKSSGSTNLHGTTTNNSKKQEEEEEEEEEMSLEGPPEPVRFPSSNDDNHHHEELFHHDQEFTNQASSAAAELLMNNPQGGLGGDYYEEGGVPCLFSLRHPLDEIRPVALSTSIAAASVVDDESSSVIGNNANNNYSNNNNMKLFTNVHETLVYVGMPRLFHGTIPSPSSSSSSSNNKNNNSSYMSLPQPPTICVTYNETNKTHSIWSLNKSNLMKQTLPLWKTTGRGGWREEEDEEEEEKEGRVAATTLNNAQQQVEVNGVDDDTMSQDTQSNIQPLEGLLKMNNNDEEEDGLSMDQSTLHNQQQLQQEHVNVNSSVPSSFSDIHPEYSMKELFVVKDDDENVNDPVAAKAEGVDDTNNMDMLYQLNSNNNGGKMKNTKEKDKKNKTVYQRHVFLATDLYGMGDLVLCMFVPKNNSQSRAASRRQDDVTDIVMDQEGEEVGGGWKGLGSSNNSVEPALLRCYSLHLSTTKSNAATAATSSTEQYQQQHGVLQKSSVAVSIESVSHLVDLPCTSAQPVQSIPIPLAPFALNNDDDDEGVGKRTRSTGRFHSSDRDTMSTDILVVQHGLPGKEEDVRSTTPSPKIGLYRAGAIHVCDFSVPKSTLDNVCSSSSTSWSSSIVQLSNAVSNRVDVHYHINDGSSISSNEKEEEYDGDECESRQQRSFTSKATTTEVIVRASFSLVMNSSSIAETALRAIESSFVHCRHIPNLSMAAPPPPSSSTGPLSAPLQQQSLPNDDNVRLQQFPDSWLGIILPFLIRADCVRLFQQRTVVLANNESKNMSMEEDIGWYSLTVVLLNLLGMTKVDEVSTARQKICKPSDPDKEDPLSTSSDEWEILLQSDFHSEFCEGEGRILFGDSSGLEDHANAWDNSSPAGGVGSCDEKELELLSSPTIIAKLGQITDVANNMASQHTLLIFDALHLLHEDSRLCQSRGRTWTRRIGTLLLHAAEQMSPLMLDYEDHYHRHLGSSRCESNACNSYSIQVDNAKQRLSNFAIVPCIMSTLDTILQLDAEGDASYVTAGYKDLLKSGLNGVCCYTWMVLRLFVIIFDRNSAPLTPAGACHRDRLAIMAMLDEGIYHSIQLHDELPVGVALPLLETIRRCRLDPPQVDSAGNCWPPAAFDLVGRNDLAQFLSQSKLGPSSCTNHIVEDGSPSSNDPDNDGLVGLEEYSSMIFPDDNRVREAARLLRSSRPLFLRVPRPVELSDHDYERSKQEALMLLCRRSIALPVGRGMLTLGTHNMLSAEQLLIPNIVLNGRVPPNMGILALDMSSCPANFRVWPEFHNGVAAGLRLPHASADKNERTITRTWIKFNKPLTLAAQNSGSNSNSAQTPTPSYAHGGFLMGLGLRGYLSTLTTTDLTDYLTQGTITTTVGIFLGMAANKRGSCDPSVSKMLCLHIPSLLPPSFIPMDLASTVQAAAVAGIGLLYQGSSHRLMTEFLLNEIGRQPMKDQNGNDREGFSLVCGLALGCVNLGCGASTVSGLEDLRIEERLHRYITGVTDGSDFHGRKEGFDGTGGGGGNGEMDKNSRIFEVLNRDITAPGATLALGLMYIKSHNVSIASSESLQIPDTHFLLDYVRPDLLALRVVSRSLILWNDVAPTPEWIDRQIPSIVKSCINLMKNAAKRAMSVNADSMDLTSEEKTKNEISDFDPQAIRQANAFIIAGSCFALGLKYAGSANQAAASAIIQRVLWFLELRDNKDVVTLTQRPDSSTLITCLCTASISLAMVMAGTGDLDSFRLFRTLRWKCDDDTQYGTHMAFGTAIGLLFLGGGKCTLGSKPEDVAMLIAAFYPHFPILSSDNQYHLQALRHLYVLAVQERILEACDVDSNEKVCIPIELRTANSNKLVQASTPFLVANDSKFVELQLKSDRYYQVRINTTGWSHGNLALFVKRKAGNLSYIQDPNGLRSLSMQTRRKDRESFLKSVNLFSDDAKLTSFAEYFCFSSFGNDKLFERFCSDIVYECMKEEKSDILPMYLKIFRLIEHNCGVQQLSIEDIWDAKLLKTYVEKREMLDGEHITLSSSLVDQDTLSVLIEHIDTCFNTFSVSSLVQGHTRNWCSEREGQFLVWNDVPIKLDFA